MNTTALAIDEVNAIADRLYPQHDPSCHYSEDEQVEIVCEFFHSHPGPFRYYPNVQREGRGWVGQDRCIDPEPEHRSWMGGIVYCRGGVVPELFHDTQPIYPPTPKSARVFPWDLKRDTADRIIGRLS